MDFVDRSDNGVPLLMPTVEHAQIQASQGLKTLPQRHRVAAAAKGVHSIERGRRGSRRGSSSSSSSSPARCTGGHGVDTSVEPSAPALSREVPHPPQRARENDETNVVPPPPRFSQRSAPSEFGAVSQTPWALAEQPMAEGIMPEPHRFHTKRDQRQQQAAEDAIASRSTSRLSNAAVSQAGNRVLELERMLKQALVQGAQLMRENEDLENAKSVAEQRLRQFNKIVRGRLQKERRQTEKAIARASRAEALLHEYMEMNLRSAGGVVEAHMQQLVDAGRGLSQTVEEQAEIIDVLRGLLQDHKDFIRRELGASMEDLTGATSGPSPLAPPLRRVHPSKGAHRLSMENSSGFIDPPGVERVGSSSGNRSGSRSCSNRSRSDDAQAGEGAVSSQALRGYADADAAEASSVDASSNSSMSAPSLPEAPKACVDVMRESAAIDCGHRKVQ